MEKIQRYRGQEIRGLEGPGRYYLIDVSPERGGDHWYASPTPGRTNMSHEIRTFGWLGSTNGTSRTAHGCIEAVRGASGRLRIRPIDPARLAADEELGA